MTTGAGALVRALEEAGPPIVFGLPGVHNLAVWSELRTSTAIRLVGVRHEQAAVYAADGLARTGADVGVAVTTTGPGAANTLGAVGEAWASGVPVVVIATDIPTTLRRNGVYRGVLHETRDQAAMFRPVTKEVKVVRRADEIAPAVRSALAAARIPPAGPVYVQIPTDLLSVTVETHSAETPAPGEATSWLSPDEIAGGAALLRRAVAPLIWAGRGAVDSGAGAAVAAIATQLGAPVLETYGARGLLPQDHPCWVGLPPHVPEAGELWDQADVVLAVGSDFDGMMTQNWQMPAPRDLVSINVDAAATENAYPASVTITGDARLGCEAMLDLLPARQRPAPSDLPERRVSAFDRIAREEPQAIVLLDALARGTGPETPVFADMCVAGYWTAAFLPFAAPRRLAYPVGWGTLGYALPASMGAAAAAGGPVLAITGDGGALFACGELATIAQEQFDLTILLVDDGGYGMLRFDQRHAGEATFGVDLLTPDWCAVAEAFGMGAKRTSWEDLETDLEAHLGAPGPSMLVLSGELRPPPTTSPLWYRRHAGTRALSSQGAATPATDANERGEASAGGTAVGTAVS